ncbi:GbsR/MarR family transcriptional regulator [Tumebacillus lipolyticus]|uniref:GbsR/MarR family transcriptional regulator n=1 Tax=Tumebacillus lipolyticus TaxID=1280370 RepID=A0ABW5A1T1_9BACL
MDDQFLELAKRLHASMARFFEQELGSSLSGRIFSLLLFAPEALSLEEIAKYLGVTKAAISVQIRPLERGGLCYRMPRGSDRKDYYKLADDFILTVLQLGVENLLKMNDFLVEAEARLAEVKVSEADEASRAAAWRRTREMSALYQLLAKRLDGFEEEWEQRKKEL